jgi:hypothetical protein
VTQLTGEWKAHRLGCEVRFESFHLSIIYVITLILIAFLNVPNPVRADAPDRQDLRDRLKLLWDSLASIEIRCEEYVADARGDRDLVRFHTENHFCHKKENYWFCDMQLVSATGVRKPIDQIRQDGLRRQQVRMFRDFPGEISDVDIKNQVSTPLEYAEAKFSALWLILPGGTPPYIYLDQGAPISKAEDYGPSCVAIDAVHRNNRLRLILDGDHDWLPRRVESSDGEDIHIHEVTHFARDNNKWFPSEGQFTHPTPKGLVRKLFVVTQARINREVDEGLFRLPVLPPGVRISNDIAKNVSFQGGEQAYPIRQSKYLDKDKNLPHDNAALPRAQPILADRTPRGWPWSGVIIGSAAGLILIAAGMWWRGR